MPETPTTIALTPDDFDTLDAILDDLRNRYDETPQWEFCEGFMAALVCCRRPIAIAEVLDVLLAVEEGSSEGGSFADAAQKAQFLSLWERRWTEVEAALCHPVKSLDEAAAYHPEVMDVRGAVAGLSEAERAELGDEDLPSFAQVWALGFMFAVESWPEEWAAPRDKEAGRWLDASLQSIVALTEDDEAAPAVSPFSEDGAPSLSVERLNAFANAVWAVYDLKEIWSSLGPRVETVRKTETPGRNDLCSCGSGKKYKKCHGA
jgi:uncharacterized protein